MYKGIEKVKYMYNIDYSEYLPLYITSVGINFKESYIERPEGFHSYQMILTVDGEGTIKFEDNQEIQLKAGDLLILPSKLVHSYRKTSDAWITYWVSYLGDAVSTIHHTLGINGFEVIHYEDVTWFTEGLELIYRLTSDYNLLRAKSISSHLYSLLLDLRTLDNIEDLASKKYSNKLSMVLDYIEHHYMETITLDDMCEVLKITPQYLCSLFKNEMGKRPITYLNEVRINRSVELLLNTDRKVADITRQVGYMHTSYFGAIFKKAHGVSPTEFVRIHKR